MSGWEERFEAAEAARAQSATQLRAAPSRAPPAATRVGDGGEPSSLGGGDEVAALLEGTVAGFLFGAARAGSTPQPPPSAPPSPEGSVTGEPASPDGAADEVIEALRNRIASVRAELASFARAPH